MRPGEAFAEKSRSLENLHHLGLTALLRELVRKHGRKEAAEVLGIDPRTLDAGLEEQNGEVKGRIDALEKEVGRALEDGGFVRRAPSWPRRGPGSGSWSWRSP